MFALWYLSLAVDELRKHFGWTFFDIFYTKSKTATNAIENQPTDASTAKQAEPAQSITSKPAEPAQSNVSKPAVPTLAPKVSPAPTPTPAATPSTTQAPVTKPVAPPTPKPKPVVEPPKPVPTPVKPKPETITKPNPVPITPLKSVDQAHEISNGSVKDAMDKKFMEMSKVNQNGNNMKNSLKNLTSDFLSGENMTQAPIKINKLSKR